MFDRTDCIMHQSKSSNFG